MAATAGYLVWRAGWTLDGVSPLVSIPLLALEVSGLAAFVLLVINLWDPEATPPADPVDRTDQELAVLIPTYNESSQVLVPTIAAAVDLRLPHQTWVLDDGRREWVREAAEALGARYLTRPGNNDAKAGNLNHALDVIDADLVAIFDADHVARPDFLRNTVGYFDDPDVALVQTPQEFYNTGSFEQIGDDYLESAFFYRVIQAGKNRWNAASWCGTNALVRAEALRDVGGVATETITEDFQTSIRLHRNGWKTVYHNEVLARGLAAGSFDEYATQRLRWGQGAMQVLRLEKPLRDQRLSLAQRASYAFGFLGWIEPVRRLVAYLIPLLVLLTGKMPIAERPEHFIPVFVTVMALQTAAIKMLGRGRHKTVQAAIFDMSRLPVGLAAAWSFIRPGSNAFEVTAKGRTGDDRDSARVPTMLTAMALVSVGIWAWALASLAGLTPIAYVSTSGTLVALAFALFDLAVLWVAMRRIVHLDFGSERREASRMAAVATAEINNRTVDVSDLSIGGAALLDRLDVLEATVGDEIVVSLHLYPEVELAGTVIGEFESDGPDAIRSISIEFHDEQWRALGGLSRALLAIEPGRRSETPATDPAAAEHANETSTSRDIGRRRFVRRRNHTVIDLPTEIDQEEPTNV